MNILAFILFGIDKNRSINKKWRIKESTLILCAFLMGGIGSLLGMVVFNHKTSKMKFRVLVPLGFVFNILVVVGGFYVKKRFL